MKGRKKALAVNIASAVQNKLSELGIQSKKELNAIEKSAKKLADKLTRISLKEEKKLKQIKKSGSEAIKANKKEGLELKQEEISQALVPEMI